MQNGRLILSFEKGDIKGVYINAGLDEFYKRLFIKAKVSAKRFPNNPEHGIKVIIFGVFYIESICNGLLQQALSSRISPKYLAKSIWEGIKRSNIHTKLDIVISASGWDRAKSKKYLNKVERLFKLRNRLAHFKDKDQPWLGPVLPEDLLKVLTTAPESSLMHELKGAKIQSHANDIEQLDKWIRSIFGNFIKFETITLKKIRKTTQNCKPLTLKS